MPGFVLSTGVAKMSGHCLGLRVSIVQTILSYGTSKGQLVPQEIFKKKKEKHNFSEETSISIFLRDDSFS